MKIVNGFTYYINLCILLVIMSANGFSLEQDISSVNSDNTEYGVVNDAGPLQFLQQITLGDDNQNSLDGTIGNPIQYYITMTADQTTVRSLVVSEYPTRSGNTCTGTATATATMTASADETFLSGHTYTATNASSWSMVNNNGGGAAWKKVCTKYEYKNLGGTVLHTKMCAAWYSGASGGSVCSSGTCGQNTTCSDSW